MAGIGLSPFGGLADRSTLRETRREKNGNCSALLSQAYGESGQAWIAVLHIGTLNSAFRILMSSDVWDQIEDLFCAWAECHGDGA
jgi:hypothetical protein